ncbi:MAG: HAD family phosphatase [Alloprevotella sp.]|nr:HAD family phosphatase [Alloprevotella sp.]
MTSNKKPVLLIDYGGVLVDLTPERCFSAFDSLGINIRPYLDLCHQRGILSQLERGLIEPHDLCEELRRASGATKVSDEEIYKAFYLFVEKIQPERLQTLYAASQHYDIALLSNTNRIHWGQANPDFFILGGENMLNRFCKVFLSFELHLMKPSAEIFDIVVRELDRKPEDIIFFDDSELNCQAAAELGIRTIHAELHGGWLRHFETDGHLRPTALCK